MAERGGVAANLVATADRDPERTALRVGDETMSYGRLLARARTVADRLRELGLERGDRVGLISPNVPTFPVAFYGALLAGCAVVPMNPLLTSREVGYYLEDSGAGAVLAYTDTAEAGRAAAGERDVPVLTLSADGRPDGDSEPGDTGAEGPGDPATGSADAAGRDVAAEPSDVAVILYTSGTTGKPKGALLTHHNLDTNAAVAAETLLEVHPDDVLMGCLPLFHVFGLTCGLNTAVRTGAALALLPRFDPSRALQLIAGHGVTVFLGVPTMYSALLGATDEVDTSTLRVCISGGAAMPVEVMRSFEERFHCIILEGYGLSETSPVAAFNHPDQERKPGSIGTPVRGMELCLLDDDGREVADGEIGEIAIRGEGVMAGYHNRPEATAEVMTDGWFRTGDIGRRDDDGYYVIVDRKKQLIIRGGYNVYPREVEEALYEHPAVAEAAVVGLEHRELGEEIGAAITLKEGATADADELRAFTRERVAAYKYPRRVWFVDALPKGPTGKILHREIVPPDEGTEAP